MPKGKISIRMYNVGFGDSFLVTIPAPDKRPRRILIDCGTHSAGPGPKPIKDVAGDIVTHLKESGDARIDVVIATHRHQDHVSGFKSEVWEGVEVGEVWMPWTEHPTDPVAKKIRNRQSRAALALANHPGASLAARNLAANSLTNAEAMRTLHEGFTGDPKRDFLFSTDPAHSIRETRVLPGVRVHVLGPSKDQKIIRDMNPPEAEHYMRLLEAKQAAPDGSHEPLEPFHPKWTFSDEELGASGSPLTLPARDQERLREFGELDDLAAAVALEDAINGTSLMLMFQIGKAHLLFTGDAQWGTWKRAMDDPEWSELLEKTTFYKVGHHGSHNATPVRFVETLLGKSFWAMASTRKDTTDWDIPRMPLLKKLRDRSPKVVRSDEEDLPDPAGFTRDAANAFVDVKIPL